ncbi:hypothetical protein OBBRIDRAFT_581861 [Obba rivulosa]|uniref:Uncharacterized protein n=1 Tax=Obba rivulosa TaxID=1052685 RepID=A0A8E2B3J8_9APHY|nr:hypothetical protein OBBRIDRAFT_581861 [Obba rivulosa]
MSSTMPTRVECSSSDRDQRHDSKSCETGCASTHSDGAPRSLLNLSESRQGLPDGWTMCVHPRGSVYFRQRKHILVTDEDIRDPDILEKVATHGVRATVLGLPSDVELHVHDTSAAPLILYIRHDQQIASYEAEKLTDAAIRGATIPQLVRQRRLYWTYVHHHPVHIPFPEVALIEARSAIRSYQLEYLHWGRRMVAPFSKVECGELLQMTDSFQEERTPTATSFVAWILRQIYSFRIVDGYGHMTHGQLGHFRRTLTQPPEIDMHLSTGSRVFLAFLTNVVFLGIPNTYLEHVQGASVFRGRLSSMQENWESFTKQLIQEYSDFILVSTVLLSATMGMLAVPNVEQTTKVFALISIFASLGSIAIGVFFTWRHQRHEQMPEANTFAYIHNAKNNALGLPGHAILLSLPPVLLVWSLIAFTIAVVAYTLETVTGGAKTDVASTWITVVVFILVCGAVFAGLYTFTIIWKWQSKQVWTSRCMELSNEDMLRRTKQ